MIRKKTLREKIVSILKREGMPLSLRKQVEAFEKIYLDKREKEGATPPTKREIRVAWADSVNQRNKEHNSNYVSERKGIARSDFGYFLKTAYINNKGGTPSINKEINSFILKYISEKISENPTAVPPKKLEAKIAWADMINEDNQKRGLHSFIIQRKGLYKDGRLYFAKTLREERKYRDYLKELDKDNNYDFSQNLDRSYRRAVLKKLNKKFFTVLTCCFVAYVVFFPIIRSAYLEWKADRRPPSKYENEDIYPNEDVKRDENGGIIEFPVRNEELQEAHSMLIGKLKRDFEAYGVNLNAIGSIYGIYEHDLGSSADADTRKMIEFLVNSEDKIYSIQYIKDGEIDLNTSENGTRGIMSLLKNLNEGCVYGASELTPEKQEILDKFGGDAIYVGDYFEFGDTQSGRALYTIPIYSENGCKLYSVPENELLSEDEVYSEFFNFLDNKNEIFTEKAEGEIPQKYSYILSACDRALESYLTELAIVGENEGSNENTK